MKRQHHRWRSEHLAREMDVLVFGERGARVLVFPPRVGKCIDYENHGMVDALAEPIERGWLQLFCLDSADEESLYCNWKPPRARIERHIEYERYVLDEAIPFSHQLNSNPCLIAHGVSLGAFHAVNLTLRHPGRFQRLVAFSGRYDLTSRPTDFYDLFEGYYDQDIYYHTPSHFLPRLEAEQILAQIRQIDIVLTVGQDDPFLTNNQELSAALHAKGIPHAFYVWGGRAHRFHCWQQMARLYFQAPGTPGVQVNYQSSTSPRR